MTPASESEAGARARPQLPSRVAPLPGEIYARAAEEGEHRLTSGTVQLLSRGFIAGFNIVFGIIALAVVAALAEEHFGRAAGELAGGVAFGIGLVVLVVGRSELFTENFLDPVAAILERGTGWLLLARLWAVTLVINLIGGGVFVLLITTEGAMPERSPEPLVRIADEIAREAPLAAFTNAIAAGAILTLMTWLLQAVNTVGSRIVIAWIAGAFVALGPFNHVVVTVLHLLFGVRYEADVAWSDFATTAAIATAGNLVGGVVFVTLTHIGQAKEQAAS